MAARPNHMIDLRALYIGQMGRCFTCGQIMAPTLYGLSRPTGWVCGHLRDAKDDCMVMVLVHAHCNDHGQTRSLTWRETLDYGALLHRAESLLPEKHSA